MADEREKQEWAAATARSPDDAPREGTPEERNQESWAAHTARSPDDGGAAGGSAAGDEPMTEAQADRLRQLQGLTGGWVEQTLNRRDADALIADLECRLAGGKS